MQTKDLVLGLIIIVLLITTIIYATRSGTHASQEQAAEEMSVVLAEHLKSMEYPSIYGECRGIGPGRFPQLQACLEAAESQGALTAMFREDEFKDYDARTNASGFLVIENQKGGKTFESAKFTLRFNNEEVGSGCSTPGEIAPGFTCRMDFGKRCEPGDNLEITYEDQRAYLKTC